MKLKKDALPRLTLKAAKTLVSRHLGISPVPLEREPCGSPEVCTYTMMMGCVKITVENDWYSRSRFFIIKMGGGDGAGDIRMVCNPTTLERDYAEEFERHDKDRADDFADQICSMGIEGCRHILQKWGHEVQS